MNQSKAGMIVSLSLAGTALCISAAALTVSILALVKKSRRAK